jgi:CDP-diacylglycerol--glycerol-3-phosphate 3-phosphatidyltransferase
MMARQSGMHVWLLRIPLLLTMSRAALAPVMIVLALAWPQAWAFVLCLVLAFLSDVFDGIIARRLGIATANLRRLDSLADSIFYVAAVYAVWVTQRAAILEHLVLLGMLAALELTRYAFDFTKFRREAAYHMWSSKLWGVALLIGFIGVLGNGETGWPVLVATIPGIVADLEGLLISCILPIWRNDVPTVLHAWRIRQHALQDESAS